MPTLLPRRPGALPYEKCPNPSSFHSLLPLVLWKGNQLICFQSYSIVLLIFEYHMNRIIVFLKFFYKWLFSLKIVRCIRVVAYSNCSLPHIVLSLWISHSLMYLPGLVSSKGKATSCAMLLSLSFLPLQDLGLLILCCPPWRYFFLNTLPSSSSFYVESWSTDICLSLSKAYAFRNFSSTSSRHFKDENA